MCRWEFNQNERFLTTGSRSGLISITLIDVRNKVLLAPFATHQEEKSNFIITKRLLFISAEINSYAAGNTGKVANASSFKSSQSHVYNNFYDAVLT